MTKGRNESKRFITVVIILAVLLLSVILLSIGLGTLSLSPAEILNTLIGQGTKQQDLVLFTIRLPRIVIALLIGSALAVSGVILQSITSNDLAEPGILGISSGSVFFVVAYIFFTNGKNYYSMSKLTIFTMPIIAFIGGILAAGLIYIMAWKKGIRPARVLLVGIGVNAAFSALTIIMQLRFAINDFNKILMWTSGSIWGVSWNYVLAVLPFILIFLMLTIYKSRYLDVFVLGDEISTGLGVHVEKERLTLMFFAVALAASATAVAGSVSFVGLMAPHIARRLTGPKHKYLIVSSMLTGMILVVLGDLTARNLFAPIELHLGIVISIIGVPYFIYLMLKQ